MFGCLFLFVLFIIRLLGASLLLLAPLALLLLLELLQQVLRLELAEEVLRNQSE